MGQSSQQKAAMNNKVVGYILFALALTMLALGWFVQGLPPVVTGIGFGVIGLYIFKSTPPPP